MDITALKKEAKNARITPERMLELAAIETELARLIAKRNDLTLVVYHQLAKSRDATTRASMAKNPKTPLEVLEILAKDRQWSVAKAVLGAKVNRTMTLSRVIFETIVANPRFSVRQSAAEHSACPPDLLERLASDKAVEVRSSVAENRQTPSHILASLSHDSDTRVLWQVVRHANTNDETLDQLAHHPEANIREESICPYLSWGLTRSIPLARLVHLSSDPERKVLEAVLHNSNSPTWLVEQVLAANPSLLEIEPQLYLRGSTIYGSLGYTALGRAVSEHPDLAFEWLERIATIINTSLGYLVVHHVKTTPALLDTMARAYLADVALSQHNMVTGPEKALLEDHIFHNTLFLASLTQLEQLPEPTQAAIVAGLSAIPLRQHVVDRLKQSPFEVVLAFSNNCQVLQR
jgi:hypothetical protein